MEERKFTNMRKEEFNIKEFIKKTFGKGKISSVRLEYTPVGEKIIIATHKPGLIIGKRGEKMEKITEALKKKFKMENPHIDVAEISKPEIDSQLVADEMALSLERFGSIRFKAIAYRVLTKIKDAGALGAELRLSGKLPGKKARPWRFAFGYLKKVGDTSKVVSKAESVAETIQGVIGIKVSILAPDAKILDKIDINEKMITKIKNQAVFEKQEDDKKEKKSIKKIKKK